MKRSILSTTFTKSRKTSGEIRFIENERNKNISPLCSFIDSINSTNSFR